MLPPERHRSAAIARPPALLCAGLIALLSLSWGFHWPILKIGLGEIPPLTFRGTGTFAGGAALFAFAWLAGKRLWPTRREARMLLWVSLANITAWQLLTAYGLTLMPAGRAIILAYTMPAWTVLLSALALGEPIDRARLVGLALGIAGMAVLIGNDALFLGRAPVGALLILAAALCWAAGTVATKGFAWSLPLSSMVAWQLVIGSLPMLLAAAALESGDWALPSLWPGLSLLYSIVVATVIANLVWFRLLALYPAGIAAISTLLNPLVGVAASAWLLGETIGAAELTALALVVAAMVAVHRPLARRHSSAKRT